MEDVDRKKENPDAQWWSVQVGIMLEISGCEIDAKMMDIRSAGILAGGRHERLDRYSVAINTCKSLLSHFKYVHMHS